MKQTLLVCDAGPLILLAKLDRLEWLVAHGRFLPVVLQCVADEVLRGPFAPGEEERLEAFFREIPPEAHDPEPLQAGALSASDRASLRKAEAHPGSWLLADDRLLRRAARFAGCSVIGFAGLLLEAVATDVLAAGDARHLLDRAVSDHGYRISIALYQRLLSTLDSMESA